MVSFTTIVLTIASAVFLGLFFQADHDKLLLRYYPGGYNETSSFRGQVVWVTGASTGIGASLAFDLCKAGAHVVISARSKDKLVDVARRCVDAGAFYPLVLPLDVLQTEEHATAYAVIKEKYGRLDSLVLNPGRGQRKLAMDTELEETKELFDLNFFSYTSLARTVLPDLVDRKAGQIVVVSSLSGKIATPVASSYSATKFALHGYFDALRSEIVQHGVHVSLMCMGPVVSDILLHVVKDPNSAGEDASVKMETSRCTGLMARGMFHKIDELWIADQPLLAITFIMQYLPWTGRQLFKLVGPSRVRMLKSSGADMFSLWENLGWSKKA